MLYVRCGCWEKGTFFLRKPGTSKVLLTLVTKPLSVMMASIRAAGVTSKQGFHACKKKQQLKKEQRRGGERDETLKEEDLETKLGKLGKVEQWRACTE